MEMKQSSDIEYYGRILRKLNYEGLGYYLADYAAEDTFAQDDELKMAFLGAREMINDFTSILYDRIVDLGGDPDDYD